MSRPAPARRAWLQRAAAGGAAWAAWAAAPGWAAGRPGIELPPEAGPPRPVRVPAMPVHRLGNGLTVITVPRPGLPVVNARLLLRVGAAADPPGRPGLAAMTATLLAKGARRGGRIVNATTLAREAEALGGLLGTESGWRTLGVGMQVMTPRLPAALSLLADVLRDPVLAADELERARAQALDGLRLAFGSPSELASMVLRRAFWGDSPYGAVAPPAALQRLTAEDVRQFHTLHARPELAGLVLAGDITPERAALLAQQWLGDWSPVGALTPVVPAEPPKPQAPPLVLVDLPGVGQSAVQLAVPSAGSGAADRLVAVVANAVLGGGYSSRLNEAVRIKRGLSYGAFSDLESQPGGGMLTARTQVNHPNAAEVLALMRTELQRMAEAPPGAAELAARQATLVGAFARRLQTAGGLAQVAIEQWVRGRPLGELQTLVPELLAVTPAQVLAHAQRHWADGAAARAVVVGPLADLAPLFPESAGPVLQLTPAQLDLEQPGLVAPATR